jgi:UDP-2,3-diacylglucosamine hydrolase
VKTSGSIYFASDFHLGLPAGSDPRERENKIINWLESIVDDAKEIYLLGDVFDYWWEYKRVVPKGFTRFLGTIGRITDSGVPVHFFTGNHDMWVNDYFIIECGMIIHTEPFFTSFDNKKFLLAHGEGLGTTSFGYKLLLSIFRNKTLRVLYAAMHPNIGMNIGLRWSLNSRLAKGITREFLGAEHEDLIKYARNVLKSDQIDYFLFGHRHLAMTFRISEQSEVIFLGDWIRHGSYAQWTGEKLILKMIG